MFLHRTWEWQQTVDSMYSAFTTCERKVERVFKRVMMSHNLRDGPDERMYIHTCLYVTDDTKR
jgi:hypothetical protein